MSAAEFAHFLSNRLELKFMIAPALFQTHHLLDAYSTSIVYNIVSGLFSLCHKVVRRRKISLVCITKEEEGGESERKMLVKRSQVKCVSCTCIISWEDEETQSPLVLCKKISSSLKSRVVIFYSLKNVSSLLAYASFLHTCDFHLKK